MNTGGGDGCCRQVLVLQQYFFSIYMRMHRKVIEANT